MNNPKISVVTVCYNAVDTIEETMLSVLNQTYDNIEYIIIDGGSTDGTLEIIEKYKDSVSHWISEPDNGIYDAMNKSLEIASGKYILFLNSGDSFYNNQVLEKISVELTGDELIYGDVMMHFSNNHCEVYDGKFNKFKLTYSNICHQSIFYPKRIYKNFKFEIKYNTLADWASNIQLWKNNSFRYIPFIISNYFRGGISDSRKDLHFEKDLKILIKQNLGSLAWIYLLYRRYKIKFFRIINHFCNSKNRDVEY